MIVVPKDLSVGDAMNLMHVTNMFKDDASSQLVGKTVYLIKFQQEHKMMVWEFPTEVERDTSWDDIMATTFVKYVGLPAA